MRLSPLFPLILACLVLSACGGTPPTGEVPDGTRPFFTLALSPTSLELAPGESAPVAVTVNRGGGFTGEVRIELDAPPEGVSAEPVVAPDGSASLTVGVAPGTAATSEPLSLTVRGVSGTLSGEATLNLSVLRGEPTFSVLVFTKTNGWRHESIPAAVAAVERLGEAHGFSVFTTEVAAAFTDANLARYAAVVFLLTSDDPDPDIEEDVLDAEQQAAFERFIRAGGGYVGVHSAADTGYRWPWYGGLVGAYFLDHPTGSFQFQEADLIVENRTHPSTAHLGERWTRTEEWYNFRDNPRDRGVNVLLSLDTNPDTYPFGGKMPDDHPIAWFHDYDGGRSWYTALGHSSEDYSDPEFLRHILGGILYAAGQAD